VRTATAVAGSATTKNRVITLVPATETPGEADEAPHGSAHNGLPGRQAYTAAFETALAAICEAKDDEIATLRDVIDGLRASISRAEDRTARAGQERGALRDRLTAMQEHLGDAHVALQTAAAADARAGRAEQGRDEERARAEALRDRVEARENDLALMRAALDQTEAEARKAHAEAADLRQAEEARNARGLMARLRAAWRGE
jgi:chromosome segregation ATPase